MESFTRDESDSNSRGVLALRVLADPRLSSLHLDATRRQDYHQVKEVLVYSCGQRTLNAECQPEGAKEATVLCNGGGHSANLNHALVDKDFTYPLKSGVNTLGRSQDNDIYTEDLYASRRHCVIVVHSNQVCELHDTASKNGTFLNGNRVMGPITLHSGDEIRIGDHHLVFLTRVNPSESGLTPTILE